MWEVQLERNKGIIKLSDDEKWNAGVLKLFIKIFEKRFSVVKLLDKTSRRKQKKIFVTLS